MVVQLASRDIDVEVHILEKHAEYIFRQNEGPSDMQLVSQAWPYACVSFLTFMFTTDLHVFREQQEVSKVC